VGNGLIKNGKRGGAEVDMLSVGFKGDTREKDELYKIGLASLAVRHWQAGPQPARFQGAPEANRCWLRRCWREYPSICGSDGGGGGARHEKVHGTYHLSARVTPTKIRQGLLRG
jgi:hypothetical protein